MAEARYLRAQGGPGLKIAYAGTCPPVSSPDLDAAITFGDLDQLFRIRGVSVPAQAGYFKRVPEERRRHLSAAGGMPLALLEESRYSSRRFRKIRGLDALPAVARAVSVDRLDLGFVDILSTEGALDHPLSGPQEELYWRRELLASTEPPRSRQPVVDGAVVASIGATFAIKPRRVVPDPEAVAAILEQIGRGRTAGRGIAGPAASTPASGSPKRPRWAGVDRQCTPYQERRRTERSGGGGGHDDRAHDVPGAPEPPARIARLLEQCQGHAPRRAQVPPALLRDPLEVPRLRRHAHAADAEELVEIAERDGCVEIGAADRRTGARIRDLEPRPSLSPQISGLGHRREGDRREIGQKLGKLRPTVSTTTGSVERIRVPHGSSSHNLRYSAATSSSPMTPRVTARKPAS